MSKFLAKKQSGRKSPNARLKKERRARAKRKRVEVPDSRQTGKTTRAMLAAPQGAVFVWVNGVLAYPKQLATKIGRTDLKIVSPQWLEDGRWKGLELSGIVLDPDTRPTLRQWDGLHEARFRVRIQAYGAVKP